MLTKKIISNSFLKSSVRTFSSQANKIEYKDAKPFKSIPGIKSPWAAARLMMPGGRYYNKSLSKITEMMQKDFGDLCMFNAQLGQALTVMTFNPDDYEHVFRLEGKWPYRRGLESFEYFRKKVRPDLFPAGAGLTIEQGEAWGDFRTKVNQIMMQPRNAKQYIPKIDEVVHDFIIKMRHMRDDKMEMPATFWLNINEWALESIALIALDTRLGILNDDGINSEEGKRFNLVVKEIFELSYKYDILPSIWRFFKTPGFNKAMKTYEEAAEIAMKHVQRAVERYEKNPSTSDEQGILEKLLKIDKGVALVMAVDMIGAGVDTTSAAVSYVLYNIAKHPDKQEKLREEVMKILPTKESKLDPKSFDNAPYLRAVIKETFRLYPVTNGNIRSLKQDTVLQGYQIPKGTDIFMGHIADRSHFEDPKKYIPERWLKNNEEKSCPHAKNAHPFALLPFGFGSRMCIGKRLADSEIEVLVARIVREFKLSWDHPDLKVKSVLLNFPDSPLKFKMVDI